MLGMLIIVVILRLPFSSHVIRLVIVLCCRCVALLGFLRSVFRLDCFKLHVCHDRGHGADGPRLCGVTDRETGPSLRTQLCRKAATGLPRNMTFCQIMPELFPTCSESQATWNSDMCLSRRNTYSVGHLFVPPVLSCQLLFSFSCLFLGRIEPKASKIGPESSTGPIPRKSGELRHELPRSRSKFGRGRQNLGRRADDLGPWCPSARRATSAGAWAPWPPSCPARRRRPHGRAGGRRRRRRPWSTPAGPRRAERGGAGRPTTRPARRGAQRKPRPRRRVRAKLRWPHTHTHQFSDCKCSVPRPHGQRPSFRAPGN